MRQRRRRAAAGGVSSGTATAAARAVRTTISICRFTDKSISLPVAKIGFHSLRHAHITALLDGGAPLESIRSFVGHSSIGMTAKYYHDNGEATEKALQALPAFGHSKHTLPNVTDATGAKLEGVLTALEGMGREELARGVEKLRELLGR